LSSSASGQNSVVRFKCGGRTPTSLRSEDQTPAGYLQAKQLREHFLGATPTGQTAVTPPPVAPALPPAQTAPSDATPGKKLKLGRGCS
jgi:hypothetical protein